MDRIPAGSTNRNILFGMKTAGLTIADMKLGYVRWTEGSGASFTETLSGALTELTNINSAHQDNYAKYMSTEATSGNKFVLRVCFPDAAFATGADRVICNVYDSTGEVVAHRIFNLRVNLSGYVDGYVYVDDSAANTNTIIGRDGTVTKPVSTLAAGKILADQLNKKLDIKGSFTSQDIDLGKYEIRSSSDQALLGGDAVNGIVLTSAKVNGVKIGANIVSNSQSIFENCWLDSWTDVVANSGLDGTFNGCRLDGELELRSGANIRLNDCYGSINTVSSDLAVLRYRGTVVATVNVINYKGKLTIEDMNDSDHELEIYDSIGLDLTLNSSCTAGSVTMNGVGNFTRNSSGQNISILDYERLYNDGKVYIDSTASNTNTLLGYDGTYEQPVSSLASAKTLADQLSKKITIKGSFSNIQNDFVEYEITSWGSDAFLSGDSVDPMSLSDSKLEGVHISGDVLCSVETRFSNCTIDTLTNSHANAGLQGVLEGCRLEGDIELRTNASVRMKKCFGTINDTSEDIAKLIFNGTAEAKVNIDGFNGFLGIKDMNDADFKLEAYNMSHLSLEASCTDGVAVLTRVDSLDRNSAGTVINITDAMRFYPDGFVYYDAAASNTNILLGYDGTKNNPVSDFTSLKTLGDLVAKKIRIKGTLADDGLPSYLIEAWDATATLNGIFPNGNGSNLSGSIVKKVEITGYLRCDNTTRFHGCKLNAISLSAGAGFQGHAYDCLFSQTIPISRVASAEAKIHGGWCDADSAPSFDFQNADNAAKLTITGLKGAFDIAQQANASSHVEAFLDIGAIISFRSDCTLGTAKLTGRGVFKREDGTAIAINLGDWEQLLPTEFSGNAQAGGASTITLDNLGSPAIDDFINTDYGIFIYDGTGKGQTRRVSDYVAASKIATVERAWDVVPDVSSKYMVFPFPTASASGMGDWTANQKAEIITVLGITGSGTPSKFPTDGALRNLQNMGKYWDGFIYYDESASNTNTVLDDGDGAADNPVSSWAAAKTLAEALGTRKISVRGNLEVNTAALSFEFVGHGLERVVGPSAVSQLTVTAAFEGNTVRNLDFNSSGLTTGIAFINRFYNCRYFSLPGPTGISGTLYDCTFVGSSVYDVINYSTIIGGGLDISWTEITYNFVTAFSGLSVWGQRADTTKITNMAAGGELVIAGGNGAYVIEASCVGGTIDIYTERPDLVIDNSGVGCDVTVYPVNGVNLATNATNDTSIKSGVDAALDAANVALGGVPNVETGSLRDMIQVSAYINKLGKTETLTLQTLLDEGGSPFATRTISIAAGLVTFGELN